MKVIIYLIFFIAVTHGVAQTSKIDSLRSKLGEDRRPNVQISLHHKLIDEFYKSAIYYDSAFYYAKKGYQIALTEDLPKEQVDFLFNIAAVYYMTEKRELALQYYEQCLELAKKENLMEFIPAIFNNIGDIYMKEKEYVNAKTYFEEVVDFGKKNQKGRLEAIGYLNLGEIFFYENDFQKSITYFEKSEAMYKLSPPKHIGIDYLMARTYLALDQPKIAEQKALEGYRAIINSQDYHSLYDYVLLLSKIYADTGMYKEAVGYNKLALAYNDSLNVGKDLSEVEKSFLHMELQEQNNKLQILQQKNKYIGIIYIIGSLVVILLVILITRQRKIVRMTKDIHDIQNSLIKYELDIKKNKNKHIL
ncbi:MAG: tetratricopeptide repeat protein [Aequorivita sp.]|nr:tetratricopeptide repeat protein [Aequorivita sp.]